jgi:hypothetical protein
VHWQPIASINCSALCFHSLTPNHAGGVLTSLETLRAAALFKQVLKKHAGSETDRNRDLAFHTQSIVERLQSRK